MALSKLGPGLLTLGDVGEPREFGLQVSTAILSPEVDSDDPIAVLSGDEYAGDDTETWTLSATLYQDYSAESLLLWLYENAGTEVPFTFVPSKDGVLQAKGKVVVRATALGGDVKKRNTSDLKMPCVGRPVISADYAAS